ncbi:MAG: YfiR family protein [Bacteroidia bacterium]|nr:YfiR family protein [Bacteroidia bacterium]
MRFQQPSSYNTNAKFKAVFIYGFTRYFEWPDKKKEGNFVIYVVGKNDDLISELKGLASTKKVGNQDIEVKNTLNYESGIASSIIYITPDRDIKTVTDAAQKNKNKGALIVAEAGGACKSGASINFIYIDSKLKFEYSKNAAVKAGLKTNEGFKAMATVNID